MLLALLGTLSQASQDTVVPATSPNLGQWLAGQPDRFEVWTQPGVAGRRPTTIAELEGQNRRPDLTHGNGSIAVIYPDLGEPYRSVFSEIIAGIEEQGGTAVQSYPIAFSADVAELNRQLKRNGSRVVIALGRQGLKAASGLDRDIAVVVGGVLSVPEQVSHNLMGISLTPDPGLLFAHLKILLPGTRKVIVIYDPRHNEWLLTLARDAAKAQGLELVAQEARDLASAAHLYEAAFAAADSHHDAIWLPQDVTTVDEGTILPLVLKDAWNRSVPVFSSSMLHVKKGVLFALYPNNLDLGRHLAHTAQTVLAGGDRQHGMVPLRAVLTAVNLRTANHIGINLSYQQ